MRRLRRKPSLETSNVGVGPGQARVASREVVYDGEAVSVAA
jgi:hypothetical protein